MGVCGVKLKFVMGPGGMGVRVGCLFLGFLFLLSGTVAQNSCPLYVPDTNLFTEVATVTPGSGAAACGISSTALSCCASEWYLNVQNGEDFFVASLNSLFDAPPTAGCLAKMKSLSCGICSTEQQEFSYAWQSGESVVNVCESFCNDLLLACADGMVDGLPVGDKYLSSGDWLCHDIFQGLGTGLNAFVQKEEKPGTKCFAYEKPVCMQEDYAGYYTECNNSARSFIPTLKKGVDCIGGYKPAIIEGLNCYEICQPGSYLPLGASSCSPCPVGSFSVGGGYMFNHWKDWPQALEWETYCETNNGENFAEGEKIVDKDSDSPCVGWVLNDTFIESSEVLEDSQNSVLVMKAVLVKEGSISFTYKVEAEVGYDGLLFKIDGNVKLRYSANSATYKTSAFVLSAGPHRFEWVFYKDSSASAGSDMAYITQITILGVKNADPQCTPCYPGTYAGEEGTAGCSPCGVDTYSDFMGAVECLSCPSDQFSYRGSVECEARRDCTHDDYTYSYTPCIDGTRDLIYSFTSPVTCNTANYTLPDNEAGVPCAPCNPGQHRPEGSSDCTNCPPGNVSPFMADDCVPCFPGAYAKKELYYTEFDSFENLPGVTTSCVGECATDGWRPLSAYIDSGVGHGTFAEIYLETVVELDTPGSVTYEYSVVCKDYCRFQFIDVDNGGPRTMYVFRDVDRKSVTLPLSAGVHRLQVVFSKYTALGGDRSNRLILHEYKISGVTDGPTPACAYCPAGTFSGDAAESCSLCPPGTYSAEGASECLRCSETSFAKEEGTAVCVECGPGIMATEDRMGCDYGGCVFKVREDIVFDFSPLQSDEMYGPIWDVKNHGFYLNPCQVKHNNHSCYDVNGDILPTHACQQLPPSLGYAMDLGHIMGFVPFDDIGADDPEALLRSGARMTFQGGSLGCGSAFSADFEREAHIDFFCDTSAGIFFFIYFSLSLLFIYFSLLGIGYPEPLEPVEYSDCKYQFVWKSLYACPLCTQDDFYPVYGLCSKGMATVSYQPKHRCHGGYIPPNNEQLPCTDTIKNCPPGTYLPVDSSMEDDCLDTPVGAFSIGGGLYFDWFDNPLGEAFDEHSSWVGGGELVRSGEGETVLKMSVFLEEAGKVEFEYKVVAEGVEERNRNGGFYFLLDGATVLSGVTSTFFDYVTFSHPLSEGTHVLLWRFVGGEEPSQGRRGEYAAIDKIKVDGVNGAARQPILCKEGTYQGETKQTSCHDCPENTFSGVGQGECTACEEKYFSLGGKGGCEVGWRCTEKDYSVGFSGCVNGTRRKSYTPLLPKFCYDDPSLSFPDDNTLVPCPSCPPGFISIPNPFSSTSGATECSPCPSSTIEIDGKCTPVPPGSRSDLEIKYFSSENYLQPGYWGEGEWPGGHNAFSTVCKGSCGGDGGVEGVRGWRIVNNTVESGYHGVGGGEVEVLLTLEQELVHEGEVMFEYMLDYSRERKGEEEEEEDTGLAGMQFFVDGELYEETVIYAPKEGEWNAAQTPILPPGRHFFRWVFHQPLGENKHKRALLRNIYVSGSSEGGGVKGVLCPGGSYSLGGKEEEEGEEGGMGREGEECMECGAGEYSLEGAGSCEMCPEGSYSEGGVVECEECGKGVEAKEDRTTCLFRACVFEDEKTGETYNLKGLGGVDGEGDGVGEGAGEVYFEGVDGGQVYLSLCAPLGEVVGEGGVGGGDCEDGFACGVWEGGEDGVGGGVGEMENYGRIFNVMYGEEEKGKHVKIVYEGGDMVGALGRKAQTVVKIYCDVGVTGVWGGEEGAGGVVGGLTRGDDMSYEFRHIGGCRECGEEDFEVRVGECKGGERLETRVRVGECNGPERGVTAVVYGCTEEAASLPLISVVLVGSVLMVLVLGVLVSCLRSVRLARQYETLVASREGGGEMEG